MSVLRDQVHGIAELLGVGDSEVQLAVERWDAQSDVISVGVFDEQNDGTAAGKFVDFIVGSVSKAKQQSKALPTSTSRTSSNALKEGGRGSLLQDKIELPQRSMEPASSYGGRAPRADGSIPLTSVRGTRFVTAIPYASSSDVPPSNGRATSATESKSKEPAESMDARESAPGGRLVVSGASSRVDNSRDVYASIHDRGSASTS